MAEGQLVGSDIVNLAVILCGGPDPIWSSDLTP